MKVIINEEQYHKLLLNELGNKGKGLLSFIRQNYEVMGKQFTPRFGRGDEWYSAAEISDELRYKFNLSPVVANDIVDYYLDKI